jgi:hypothetical protein
MKEAFQAIRRYHEAEMSGGWATASVGRLAVFSRGGLSASFSGRPHASLAGRAVQNWGKPNVIYPKPWPPTSSCANTKSAQTRIYSASSAFSHWSPAQSECV